jgi:hypothetical protein
VKVATAQAPLQALSPILWTLGTLLTVPVAWVAAFSQNLAVLSDQARGRPFRLLQLAVQQATRGPVQNHAILSILSLAWIVTSLNFALAIYWTPQFLKLLLGFESGFTLEPTSIRNSTFVAATLVLGSLAIDPLVKAAYLIRCFHNVSATTGEDLLVRLRRQQPALILILVLSLGIAHPSPTVAAPVPVSPRVSTVEPANDSIDPEVLNRTIQSVLSKPEYSWRAPREQSVDTSGIGDDQSLMDRLASWFKSLAKFAGDLLKSFLDWLGHNTRSQTTPTKGLPSKANQTLSEFLMWLLVAVAALVLSLFVVQLLRRRQTDPTPDVSPAVAPPLDLTAEEITADRLPEERWRALAAKHATAGDLRLALRALHLAALAHLSRRELIGLGRHKSNREYSLELRRRAASLPRVIEAFDQSIATFERIWYGGYEVSAALYADFEARVEALCVES